jgi:hypothetical protein
MPASSRASERQLPAQDPLREDKAHSAPSRVHLRSACACLLLGTGWLLAACSRPEPPDKERPPEPQAAAPARHTELRDAIQAPQDKARAVEGAVDDAAKAQRDAIEAAGG